MGTNNLMKQDWFEGTLHNSCKRMIKSNTALVVANVAEYYPMSINTLF